MDLPSVEEKAVILSTVHKLQKVLIFDKLASSSDSLCRKLDSFFYSMFFNFFFLF